MRDEEVLTKKYILNGPNNVIRLTNDNKTLYIFGDYHEDLNTQNECLPNNEYESIDIDKFLLKFFKSTDKEIDFFVEQKPNLIGDSTNHYRMKYIRQIIKLFEKKVGNIDNKIIHNELYPNIKFHFSDIRNDLQNYMYTNLIQNTFYLNDINIYNNQTAHIKYLYNFINNNIMNIKKIKEDYKNDKYIKKILHSYKNDNIQKIINKLFENLYLKNLDVIIIKSNDIINDLQNLLEKIQDIFFDIKKNLMYQVDIIAKIKELESFILYTLLIPTDLYFIRRFLDKDYIKTGILYTGSAHLCNITYLLVKYFNFTITNVYKTNKEFSDKDIIKLKENELEYIHILLKYLSLRVSKDIIDVNQCVNLFKFPDNFS